MFGIFGLFGLFGLRTILRLARLLLVLALVIAAFTGCSGDGPTGPGGSAKGPQIADVQGLIAGGTARLTGSGLAGLSSVTVDGKTVQLQPGSDTERAFQVPQLRECEQDGRAVTLVAGAASITRPISVPGALQLRAGEARTLGADALRCLQLAAGDQDFAIVAINTSLAAGGNADLLTFRTGPGAAPSTSRAAAGPSLSAHLATVATAYAIAQAGPYSANPAPFDPAYTTAQVGDVTRFVDVKEIERIRAQDPTRYSGMCLWQRSAAPTYQVQVAAVAGKTVIAVDLRIPDAATYTSAEGRAWLQKAAEIADRGIVPTMRQVFDPAFEPLKGGGSRNWHIITSEKIIGGHYSTGDGITAYPANSCTLASEMPTFVHPGTAYASQPDRSRLLASVMIHEYAHLADGMTSARMGADQSSGWLTEAWAVSAQETAARLAAGKDAGVRAAELGPDAPDWFEADHGIWNAGPASPWATEGRYTTAAQLLLHVRERLGETSTAVVRSSTLRQRLFQRAGLPGSDPAVLLRALADELGTTPAALIEEAALARALDDLVPADATLPQLRTWSRTGKPEGTSRTAAISRTMAAAPGAYAAAYFFAEGGAGLSLQGQPASGARMVLARLR